jgi:threonine dehydrogenase-like Zn-dependent dehydrogenase
MGVIEDVGSAVDHLALGDRVATLTGHSSLSKFKPAKSVWIHLPDEIQSDHAPFIRMALICVNTLRQADIQAGESLGIVGLGIVGNLGAQFGRHAGLKVIGVGRSNLRSETAARCGISSIFTGTPPEIAAATQDITNGIGCKLVLDTSGTMDGLLKAIALSGDGGTIALVGVPWVTDPTVTATEITQPVFSRYLTLKGGWEWGLPLHECAPDNPLEMLRNRYSVEANYKYALDLISSGYVKVKPLITHRIKPEMIQSAYQGLLNLRNEYLGVIIDWTKE